MKTITSKIVIKLFRRFKPFCLDFEIMDGGLFIIGIRFNRFWKEGEFIKTNSLGLFFGRKYKTWQWLDGKI